MKAGAFVIVASEETSEEKQAMLLQDVTAYEVPIPDITVHAIKPTDNQQNQALTDKKTKPTRTDRTTV
jgi:hypothetical protein